MPTDPLSMTIKEWEALSVAWGRFMEAHPEIHCPICGHRRMLSGLGPWALVPVLRDGWTDVPDPVRVLHRTCGSCGHVMLFSVSMVFRQGLTEEEQRELWPGRTTRYRRRGPRELDTSPDSPE